MRETDRERDREREREREREIKRRASERVKRVSDVDIKRHSGIDSDNERVSDRRQIARARASGEIEKR